MGAAKAGWLCEDSPFWTQESMNIEFSPFTSSFFNRMTARKESRSVLNMTGETFHINFTAFCVFVGFLKL